ncbi:MAG: hypothetical protein EHM42_02305 [Planctomycetaceae bacterium]|nr:MAG: hypothetical protein EHM42_02305 [Planctomycetaceae bacterium]
MLVHCRSIGLLTGLILLIAVGSTQAGVVAAGSTVEGQTIAEWTGDWWNWLVQEPFATNPAVDPTGEFANLNQSGPVFFVAGSFGGPTDPRTFQVPAGKYLLVPLINYVFWAPEDGADEAAIRSLAASNVDTVVSPYFELDGNALASPESHREASPAGGFILGYAPLLAEIGLSPMDRLAVADGYWVMLEPLSRGSHTLRFGGVQPGQFETNVVANITVVPEPGMTTLLGTLAGSLALFATTRRFLRRKGCTAIDTVR